MYLSSLSPQGHKLHESSWYVLCHVYMTYQCLGKQALNVIFIFIFPERMNNNWMRWSFAFTQMGKEKLSCGQLRIWI